MIASFEASHTGRKKAGPIVQSKDMGLTSWASWQAAPVWVQIEEPAWAVEHSERSLPAVSPLAVPGLRLGVRVRAAEREPLFQLVEGPASRQAPEWGPARHWPLASPSDSDMGTPGQSYRRDRTTRAMPSRFREAFPKN